MSQGVKVTTMKRGPAQFNCVGSFLHYPLIEIGGTISQGLVERLVRYAHDRVGRAGFARAIEGTSVEVYTMDAENRPSDRTYGVKFINDQGGEIEVCQIHTRAGWPFLDHGLAIEG